MLEASASMLLALPFGGVLVLGELQICYLNGTSFKSLPIDFAVFKAYGQVEEDGTRWRLGDHTGSLHVLVLELNGGEVVDLQLERLGRTSQASQNTKEENSFLTCGGNGVRHMGKIGCVCE